MLLKSTVCNLCTSIPNGLKVFKKNTHTWPLRLITKIDCWLKCLVLFALAETQSPPQQFTSSTTERTARKHPTLYCTSSPTTGILYYACMCWYCLGRPTFTLIAWHTPATGHIALTTTNEVVTNKTRRTTSQPTLMNTRKETESITTTNETTTIYTSREYVTTTSSHTPSGSFTTTGEAIYYDGLMCMGLTS